MKTVLLGLLFLPLSLLAQVVKITPQDMQRKQSFLQLRDGSVVRGQIVRQDSSLITVRKRNGDLTFIEAEQLVKVSSERPNVPPSVSQATTTAPYSVFVFRDGTQVEGTFVRRDSTMITVRKRNGQLTYFEPELLNRVDSVRVETVVDSSRTFANRFSPWLLADQTAFGLESGRAYYRNIWLLHNELSYGIASWLSVGASATVIPFIFIESGRVNSDLPTITNVRLFSKVSIPVGEKFGLGLQATYQPKARYELFGAIDAWTLQALGTIGSRQRNVTLGYGLSLYKEQYLPNRSFFSLGIAQKVSRNLTFVSENTYYATPNTTYYSDLMLTLSSALRLNRKRHAFDLGLYSFFNKERQYYYYRPGVPQIETRVETLLVPYIGCNLIIGKH